MKNQKNWRGIFFFVLASVFTGCIEEEVLPQNGLVANAGIDIAIQVNDEVQLDGSASHDKGNKPFTYKWTVKSQPQNSAINLFNSTTAKPTFKADAAGIYVLQLQISNGQFSSTDDLMITVTAIDPVPTAMILNSDITVNTILGDIFTDPLQPDYIVTSDIDVRADLMIQPGVVIAFQQDKGMHIVTGEFKAIGNANSEVMFRGIVEEPGYWKGIVVSSNNLSNELTFVTIKGAGSSISTVTNVKANLALAGSNISGASLKINFTVFAEASGYGLYVQGLSSLTHFANNAFLNVPLRAAYIPANQLHKIDVVSFTGTTGIETGGLVLEQGDVTWPKLAMGTYYVSSSIDVKTGVTVNAGTTFKMKSGVSINVTDGGYLKSIGTPELPITYGAAVNGEYWNGIFINSWNQNNILSYCTIANAGLNKFADAAFKANVAIGTQGLVSIEHSVIKNGQGYGVVTKAAERVNANILAVNNFEDLAIGSVYPVMTNPNNPSVAGVWLDQWSFNRGENSLVDGFYSIEEGEWFNGIASPWAMTNAAFGINFDENGKFTWLIAEKSPWTGCESYSAEYILGNVTITPDRIIFDMEYWRSKFINSCDTSQNVDTEVEPFILNLPYTINQLERNGTPYWELKFTNPDNSTFSFYRY